MPVYIENLGGTPWRILTLPRVLVEQERIAEEVGPDTSVDRLATLTLIWELQPHVCPTLRTILEAFCD